MYTMEQFSPGMVEEVTSLFTPIIPEVVPQDARIEVHASISRFAFLYERIRNAVDYKDEHILRKSAIIRILKRHMVLESDPLAIAKLLIRELIAARYLPNGELDEKVYTMVGALVEKYLVIRKCDVGSSVHYEWLEGILAVEIEEALVDPYQEKALVSFLYERIAKSIHIKGYEIPDAELRLQIYVACYRLLHKADNDILGFKLARAYAPEWLQQQEWLQQPQAMAERLIGVETRIRIALIHPLALRLQRTVKPWAVSLLILRDVAHEPKIRFAELLLEPDKVHMLVTRIADRKYAEVKGRVRRGAFRATLYLFLTKMILALSIEAPVELYYWKEIYYPSLAINLFFPPSLMFLISLFISIPGKNNTDIIQKNISALLSDEGIPNREIRYPAKKSFLGRMAFGIGYALMFLFSFGTLYFVLVQLHFTWVSKMIFYFFLCLVSFFAFRLRHGAQEYVIVNAKPKLTNMFIDFISLPILRSGQILSKTVSRLNVFLFLFDFIIEAPYKIFLRVLEEWFGFMKEKKDELQ